MVHFMSAETLRPETMSQEERNQIINLDYQEYYKHAMAGINSIESIQNQIADVTDKYCDVSNILRKKYHELSKEDGTETQKSEVRHKFSDNIKLWFTKIWAAIVTVFKKILDVVVSLAKTIIIAFKKLIIRKTALYTKIKDDVKAAADGKVTEKMQKRFEKFADGKIKVRTVENDGNAILDFYSLSQHLCNNAALDNYIRDVTVVTKDSKSAINIDNLNGICKQLKDLSEAKDIEVADSDGNMVHKLALLEDNLRNFRAKYILYGETSVLDRIDNSGSVYTQDGDILGLLADGNTKDAANRIIFGSSKIDFPTVDARYMFGHYNGVETNIDTAEKFLKTIMSYYAEYNKAVEKVMKPNSGYVDILTEILKNYKNTAKNDSENIKKIKEDINKILADIAHDENKNIKFGDMCKRFTNITVSIQRLKFMFVNFRQNIISNLLNAFICLDRALSAVINSVDDLSEVKNELPDTGDAEANANLNEIAKLAAAN